MFGFIEQRKKENEKELAESSRRAQLMSWKPLYELKVDGKH